MPGQSMQAHKNVTRNRVPLKFWSYSFSVWMHVCVRAHEAMGGTQLFFVDTSGGASRKKGWEPLHWLTTKPHVTENCIYEKIGVQRFKIHPCVFFKIFCRYQHSSLHRRHTCSCYASTHCSEQLLLCASATQWPISHRSPVH